MATEQRDSKIEDVNLELYTTINQSPAKHSREQPSIDTFGDNHIPSSSTITNKGIISMNMNTTSTTTTNTTASPETPSVTATSTIATYTNTTNELKEEEKQQINGHNTTNTMSDDPHHNHHNHEPHHNSNQSSNLYGGLAPSAEFHDINEEEDDHTQMIGNRYSVSNNNNSYDDDIDDGSFDIWCFCFFISSRRFCQCINDRLITYKNNNEIRSKEKRRHLGVCRYITQSIMIWIFISIYFGACLFIIFSSIECINSDNTNSTISSNLYQEMCIVRSYSTPLCHDINTNDINDINQTYTLWHFNIINSTHCDNIDNKKIFNISMDEYTYNINTNTNNNNLCPLLDDNYSINETKICYIESCNVNEVHFTDSSSTNDKAYYEWFCDNNLSTSMLIIGILGICFGQFCIMNIKQICCSMRS